ncbi:MAG: hypothetical protein JO273_00115 [Methylobacteriaceae bacterium]|nr:hypothetical protein [Methylobacteriaceae bacterium]
MTKAASEAGISPRTVYNWRLNPAFARQCDEAIEAGSDFLEDEARRRAVASEKKGGATGEVPKGPVSDRLLLALLAARRPHRFGRIRNIQPANPTDASSEIVKASLERKLARLARRNRAPRLPGQAD